MSPEYIVSIHAPAREATRHGLRCRGQTSCFNPRPRTGGDPTKPAGRLSTLSFQSTPPHGRRPAIPNLVSDARGVSIHAPAREATIDRPFMSPEYIVSIHAPAREATADARDWAFLILVSIHAPAREATLGVWTTLVLRLVSIHAPAREATRDSGRGLNIHEVSIHAPAREATGPESAVSYCLFSFNPRPRTGGDTPPPSSNSTVSSFNPRPRTGGDARLTRAQQPETVSIHAPAREATARRHKLRFSQVGFNPRPRTGGDRPMSILTFSLVQFQSTPPHGRRPSSQDIQLLRYCVSIHAPAREATYRRLKDAQAIAVSIHAPAREATSQWRGERRVQSVSIHAPAREATFRGTSSDFLHLVSIHAPAREATFVMPFFNSESLVSIHAPAREATGDHVRSRE